MRELLEPFDISGAQTQLAVVFNLGERHEIGYSWHKEPGHEFGRILSPEQLTLLRTRLGDDFDVPATQKQAPPSNEVIIKPQPVTLPRAAETSN